MTWRWISKNAVLAIHEEQITEHGGRPGIRDEGLLESAIHHARNVASYRQPDAAEIAAAYAFSIIKNHPFIDGNKRTAFVVSATFLSLNGFDLLASERDVVDKILRLAAGSLSEQALSDWYRSAIKQQK